MDCANVFSGYGSFISQLPEGFCEKHARAVIGGLVLIYALFQFERVMESHNKYSYLKVAAENGSRSIPTVDAGKPLMLEESSVA